MSRLDKPTKFELLTGNLIAEAGITALAAYLATPLASLLPVLSKSLASGRHQKRVEKALFEINEMLTKHEKEIRNLTDAQYKIINETILTILQTVEEEKIKYLKSAIENNIIEDKVSMTSAYILSRILRDISVEEILFLINNRNYKMIFLGGQSSHDDVINIDPHSNQGILFSGLIAMGLMVPGIPIMGTQGNYEFSPIVSKILEVIGT